MADGGNGNSERIGGLHIEVTAVGAETAAQQVGKAAGAVKAAGDSAAVATPKLDKLKGAFGALAAQALGFGGAMAQSGKAIVGALPGVLKLAAIIPMVGIALDMLFGKAEKREAESLKKFADETADAFDKLAASISRSGGDLAGPEAFAKLEALRDERIKLAASGIEAEKAWREWAEQVKSLERFNEVESARRAMVETAGRALELDKERAKEKEKERKKEIEHLEKMRDFEEFVATDKLRIAQEYTRELQKQKDIVTSMIEAQASAAGRFNDKLNIEQLQSMNAALTRVESAIRSRR